VNEWMENALRSMLALMEELLGLYGELGAGLELQQEALFSGDLETLDHRTQTVERLNALLRGADKRRQRLLHSLALHLDCPEETLTIGYLLSLSAPRDSSRLKSIASSLTQELRRVTASRQLVEGLLGRQTGFTKRRIAHLRALSSKRGTYGPNARMNKEAGSKLINRTV
jgi:hypothetical protein